MPRRTISPRRSCRSNFAFYRQYLRGAEVDRPRWKKCVAWVDRDLGEALGREFVARTFPPETKEKTVKMTRQIEEAMKTRIEQLDWMSPATKQQADREAREDAQQGRVSRHLARLLGAHRQRARISTRT